jgi:pyridoxamine 5'-phosphate oxidase
MPDPIQEIIRDRDRARERDDPLVDVCYLATVASAGRAEARALTLRDVGDDGLGVLINRTSPKWRQLSETQTATILIHWPSVRRQYRIWGGVAPMEAERVEAYWRRKSHGSKLLELYYTEFQAQSARVASREEFLAGIEALRRRYPDREAVPRPASLAGIYVVAREIEVWHGSAERLHDRRRYLKSPRGWEAATLVP